MIDILCGATPIANNSFFTFSLVAITPLTRWATYFSISAISRMGRRVLILSSEITLCVRKSYHIFLVSLSMAFARGVAFKNPRVVEPKWLTMGVENAMNGNGV